MIGRHRRALRVGFVLYAAVLFIATHKPGVQVNVVPGIRLDLFIHLGAFGVWTALLGLTGWVGDPARVRGAIMLAVVGVGYAVVDESSQALPIFDRVFDLADMMANATGAVLATLLLFGMARLLARPQDAPR
ncbi:MAG: hypothetical protein ACIAS6_11325 [Phycisphaerales bacterium JB060]